MARINKKRVNLRGLNEWMKALDRTVSIRVGIIGNNASAIHPDTKLTNAELGAVHEFGGTINHPGGTPYQIKKDGTAQFVSKSKGKDLPKTKPHTITIPARSFLREPILGKEGRKEILKTVRKELGGKFKSKDSQTDTANQILDDTIHMVAETAYVQVLSAFEDDKIKPPTKPASKKRRKYNPENPTLVDTRQLKRSISYEINGIEFGKPPYGDKK